MTTMSQGNKKITKRKIPSRNNKVLVHTDSLHFFKKYQQPIIKFWSVPVPQLFKSFEFGNGSRMFDKNLAILEFKYLQNKKW